MPIGNTTWGDFTCNTDAEMVSNTLAVVGATCLRSDQGAAPGVLYVLTALPASNLANWSPYSTVTGGRVINDYNIAGIRALAAANSLVPRATYVPSDIGEELFAVTASNFVPLYERVRCTLPGFGGTWTGLVDDSAAIAAAAAYAATFTPRRAIELPRRVGVAASIYIPRDVFVYGAGWEPTKALNTQVKVLAGATFSTGFVFGLNTTNGTSAAESQNAWDSGPVNGIFGVFLDNTPNSVAGARLCTFAGSFVAKDVSGFWTTQLIKQVPSVYSDRIEVERVIVLSSLNNSEYQIECGSASGGGGDSGSFRDLTFGPSENNGEPEKAIKLSYSNAGKIVGMINGAIYLQGTNAAVIDGWHCEAAKFTAMNAGFTMRNSNLDIKSDGYYPIDLAVSYDITYSLPAVFENVSVRYGMIDREGKCPAEIRTTKHYTITTVNCQRQVGSANNTCSTGLRVHNDSSAPITAWNNNAGYLSVNGKITNLQPDGRYECNLVAAGFVGTTGTITKVTSSGPSTFVDGATYYYRAQLLLDIPNLIGLDQTGAEASVVMPATGANTTRTKANFVAFNTPLPVLATFRIYRGTTTNSYDKYCDVPSVFAASWQDQGDYVNGLPWIARTAGPVDAITQTAGKYEITPTNGARLVAPYEQVPNLGDADATIGTPASLDNTAVVVVSLTADRNYTIHAGITTVGAKVKLVRAAGTSGSFNANLKNPAGTTLKALAAGSTWAVAELCNGSVWRLTGYGAL